MFGGQVDRSFGQVVGRFRPRYLGDRLIEVLAKLLEDLDQDVWETG